MELLQKRQRENRNIFACIGTLLFRYYVMQGTKSPSRFSEYCLVFPQLNDFDLLVYKIESFAEFTYLSVSYLYADSLHETHPLYLLTYNLFFDFSSVLLWFFLDLARNYLCRFSSGSYSII